MQLPGSAGAGAGGALSLSRSAGPPAAAPQAPLPAAVRGGFTSAALKNSEKSRALQERRLSSALPCPGVLRLACAWCFFAGKQTKIPGSLPPWPEEGYAHSSPGLTGRTEQGSVATTSGHHFVPASCLLLDRFLPYLTSPFRLLSNKSASPCDKAGSVSL